MWLSTQCNVLFLMTFTSFSRVSSEKVNELSADIFQFAKDFTLECLRSDTGNVAVSPLSVATALALFSQATDGSTFDELRNGLHLKSDKADLADNFPEYLELLQNSAGNSTLSIVNQIYVQQGYKLNETFQHVVAKQFKSGVESVNFSESIKSAEIINHFVEEKTNNKIKNLVKPDSFDQDSRIFSVNAIYFKGEWEQKFDPNKTFGGDFFISENETVSVEYMNVKEYFNHAALYALDARALELKYANSNYSFVIILPNNRTGLSELESKLKDFDFDIITSQMYSEEIDVTIPKFTIEFETKLNNVLKNLGMDELFSTNANLKGLLNSTEPVYVSEVVHKAFIEINEEGSEAAAATGIKAVFYAAFIDIEFRADHPFVYFIRDSESNSILFSGSYQNNLV